MGDQHPGPAWGFQSADSLMPGVVASMIGYDARGFEVAIHRGLPSPYLTFIITFDEPVITGWSVEEASGRGAARLDVLTAGLHLAPAYILQPSAQSGIQLAVHPAAARLVLGLPASELCHASYDGSVVVGADVSRLRDRLVETPDWTSRFALVDQFLRQRADRAQTLPRTRPELVEALSWLFRHQGTGRISDLAQHVQLSQRQLHSLFTAEFGIGPKRFNRLLRFDRAKRLIARNGQSDRGDLAGIAAHCGYADQSHLDREFGVLAGTSPSRWLAHDPGNIAGGYG